mmetsp:Transcript_67063/g.178894  ORF Transcript_67063/g.178894 Transcript_67063/m.178894 type:complete len:492 (+) Transcript_67063:561-2036(+)
MGNALCQKFKIVGQPLVKFYYHGDDIKLKSALKDIELIPPPEVLDEHGRKPPPMPKGVFPAEMILQLFRNLPEDYRLDLAVLGDASYAQGKLPCPLKREVPPLMVQLPSGGDFARYLEGQHRSGPTDGPGINVYADGEADYSMFTGGAPSGDGIRIADGEFYMLSDGELQDETSEDEARRILKDLGLPFPGDAGGSSTKYDGVGNGWPGAKVSATERVSEAWEAALMTLSDWVKPDPEAAPMGYTLSQLVDLKAWLEHLDLYLPGAGAPSKQSKNALKTLFQRVADKVTAGLGSDGDEALCEVEWQELLKPLLATADEGLDKRSKRSACKTDTCRVWALLHVISVGYAENPKPTTAASLLEASRNFLARYFSCRICRDHFLNAYDENFFGRDAAAADGPALFWWRLHNAASARIAAEGGCGVDRRWPPSDECPECWLPEEQPWDVLAESSSMLERNSSLPRQFKHSMVPVESEILSFLRRSYWPKRARDEL